MKFTESHEWIDEKGTVGITEFAKNELGDIVHIELPSIGKEVKQGQEIAVLESTKAASDIYAPASGTVIEVNEELKSNPSLIAEAPQGKGWLFRLKLTKPEELEELLDHKQYQELSL